MQDVKRGEVALWVVCSHREGHSKAWPAVRMQGRGLIATFLLRFHQVWLLGQCSALTPRSDCIAGFEVIDCASPQAYNGCVILAPCA